MGLDVRSWEYWRMCQIYAGECNPGEAADWIVPELLRNELWMWRDEF